LPAQPLDILREHWGYPAFRPLQAEIIQSVLDGHDTLALLPTGGGKSICFQVPAVALDGLCIVVSPLIALMKDQVRQLRERGIIAEALYSGLSRKDIDRIIDNAVYGNTQLLYLSPERLKTELLLARLPQMPLRLIAVDEAHCISQWGYDFRPPYREIAAIRVLHPEVPVIAVTATATPQVVVDIETQLEFRPGHKRFQQSFARDNLAYVVRRAESKEQELLKVLKGVPGSSIVYARSRRGTQEIALQLRRFKISADYYHAGLEPDERDRKQAAWIQNKLRVIVSTNAFGMGIDKADVRSVIHMDVPDSPEAYFQEAGRAGRDGQKAYAVLLHQERDEKMLRKQFEQAFPPMDEIRRVYRALGSYLQLATGAGYLESFDFDLTGFLQTYQLNAIPTYHALRALEQAGWISLTDAVYTPANLQIIANKDTLYDYLLKQPKLERIIKAILRTYQGAFVAPVRIREGQLANFLKLTVEQLTAGLQLLHGEGIIEYTPSKDQPQLIFTRERVPAEQMDIDQELYHFRQEQHRLRMEAMLNYLQREQCRSQLLLAYFGQPDAPPCGICDSCLRQAERPAVDIGALRRTILDQLRATPGQDTDALLAPLASSQRGAALDLLNDLLAERVVRREEAGQWFVL
jgi:ATP-dependent DNA helicase RecQ